MRIENRELFVSFWDGARQEGAHGLLIGWDGDDPSTMSPVVAYNFGVEVLSDRNWKLSTNEQRAAQKALFWGEPQ